MALIDGFLHLGPKRFDAGVTGVEYAARFDSQHLMQFSSCNLYTYPSQKPNEYDPREKVRKEPQTQDSGKEKKSGCHECNGTGQFDISRRVSSERKKS